MSLSTNGTSSPLPNPESSRISRFYFFLQRGANVIIIVKNFALKKLMPCSLIFW